MISESEIAFITACKEGNLELAQTFLQYNSDLDVSVFNEYAFITSCENGHLEIVQWLLKVNPTINISADNDFAFKYACKNRHLPVAQWLQTLKPFKYKILYKYNDCISYKINTDCKESLLFILYSLTCKNYTNSLTPKFVINIQKYL